MKRDGTTLLELIFVIVIISFLSTATYKGLQAIMIRSYKAKETTKLSLESQITVNEISNYLKFRVPYSVIGYNANNGDFQYIGDLTDNKPILEWIGQANESFVKGDYSGFIDMATLDTANNTLQSNNTNGNKISDSIQTKFHISDNIYNNKIVNLIFSGSFDRANSDTNDYNSSFGWHENESNATHDITINSSGLITIDDTPKPKFIYEKYFLVDTAYAIARGTDIDTSATCISDLNLSNANNTLFLFSNYRPWKINSSNNKGETFCADKNGNNREGNVSILMQNIDGFKFQELDYTIRINLDINKTIRGASDIHFSKMKVVF